jgi:hypothetical protein
MFWLGDIASFCGCERSAHTPLFRESTLGITMISFPYTYMTSKGRRRERMNVIAIVDDMKHARDFRAWRQCWAIITYLEVSELI